MHPWDQPRAPLKLEAVADRASPAFEALRLHGRTNMHMITALALHAQRPMDDAGLLERHLDELVGSTGVLPSSLQVVVRTARRWSWVRTTRPRPQPGWRP